MPSFGRPVTTSYEKDITIIKTLVKEDALYIVEGLANQMFILLDLFVFFLCPRLKMAEGHIEFTLCVFVYSRFVSNP